MIQQITPKIMYKLSVNSKYNPPTAREYFSRKFQTIRPDTWKGYLFIAKESNSGN